MTAQEPTSAILNRNVFRNFQQTAVSNAEHDMSRRVNEHRNRIQIEVTLPGYQCSHFGPRLVQQIGLNNAPTAAHRQHCVPQIANDRLVFRFRFYSLTHSLLSYTKQSTTNLSDQLSNPFTDVPTGSTTPATSENRANTNTCRPNQVLDIGRRVNKVKRQRNGDYRGQHR